MTKNSIFYIKNLFLAALAIIIYDGFNELFFTGSYLLLPENLLENHYFMLDAIFCFLVQILFSIWLYQIYRRHHSTFTAPLTQQALSDIPVLVLGMGGLASIWFILVDLWLYSVPMVADSLQSFDDTWSSVETEAYIWVFLSVVIIGPIVEELMFRGIVFHYLENIKTGWFPILASGICFGLWHEEPVQVVYTAMMGIILGIIYASCRDLKVLIMIHMLNNFLSTLPPFLDTPAIQDAIYYLSFLAIIPSFLILRRMIKNPTSIHPAWKENPINHP